MFESEVEKLVEFKDVRNNVTYNIYYNSGNASVYESIVVRKINEKGEDKFVESFKQYNKIYGFSIADKNFIQIILGRDQWDDSIQIDTFYIN